MAAKPALKLVNVYGDTSAIPTVFTLLKERSARINISHRKMPTLAQHRAFVRSKPYQVWFLLKTAAGECVGSVYLSKTNEIGLFIFKKAQGKGYGSAALALLFKRFRAQRFLANINPSNKESIQFFKRAGFRHIQNTYELRQR